MLNLGKGELRGDPTAAISHPSLSMEVASSQKCTVKVSEAMDKNCNKGNVEWIARKNFHSENSQILGKVVQKGFVICGNV